MSINLRNVGTELQQALKVRAASEGVTLQSLCVRFLWWGLDTPVGSVPTSSVPDIKLRNVDGSEKRRRVFSVGNTPGKTAVGVRLEKTSGSGTTLMAAKVPEPTEKLCVSCEGALETVKGKLVCMDESCGMRGIEQKGSKR